MLSCSEKMDFETVLSAEWPRLVRLCAWLSGSHATAEDLAQDTLVAAWKNRDQLTSLDKLKPWTSAIARNICLNWSRQHGREKTQTFSSIDDSSGSWEGELPNAMNLELELDRYELAALLDRALALLPPETGEMLVRHYLEESSHAEIAGRMNLKPGTVAVRIRRGKLTLQRLLQTRLKEESLAFGLIRQDTSGWEETNIWCLCCGQHHLLGKFQKDQEFALRCPHCTPQPEDIMVGMDLTQPFYAGILGNVRKFKPAYSRLLAALAPLYRQALQSPATPCPVCRASLHVLVDQRIKHRAEKEEARQIVLHCPACGWASNKTLSGLVMSLPEAQKFWRQYPRLTIQPGPELEVQGSRALLTRIKSVTSAAELTVISKDQTFEPLELHTNIPL